MIIDQLPTVSLPVQDTDEIPIERGQQTFKASVDDLNKVSKAGDTMTGILTVENASPGIYAKATDVTDGTAPSADTNQVGFRLQDKNGANIAIFTDRELTDGRQGAWIAGGRNGVYNSLYLYMDSSGNRVVSVSEQAPWRAALGLGTSGAFPLTILQGGTGATSAASAKINLGLGSLAVTTQTSTGSDTKTFSLANSTHGAIFAVGSQPAVRDILLFYVTSTGAVSYTSVLSASGLTVTTATNQIKIQNTTTAYSYYCVLTY